MKSLVFLGAGHAVGEIFEIIRDINIDASKPYVVVAILDDNAQTHGTVIEGVRVEGPLSLAKNYQDTQYVFAIGSFKTRHLRARIIAQLDLPQDCFATLVHPRAKVYNSANIGPGVIIYPYAVICANASIAPFAIIAFHSIIGPSVSIGPYAMITSNVTVLTLARVGRAAFIGVGSIIAENKQIGDDAVIVMGSVIMRDIPAGAVAAGNPGAVLYRATASVPS